MRQIVVDNFQKFHNVIQKYDSDVIYRGVSRISHNLLPKVGRDKTVSNYNHRGKYHTLDDYEEDIMHEFKQRAIPFINSIPHSEWEWWAIAQHHGLPTRFLDWTKNPLVAAYFATEDCSIAEDSVVYAVDSNQFNSYIDFSENPIGIDEIFLYTPPHINQRIIVQSGIFTVHNHPTIPLEETEKPSDRISKKKGEKYSVDRIVIKRDAKLGFREILNLYGINEATIYPGLDGLSRHLEWLTLECI